MDKAKTITLYRFSELSESAKEHAKQQHASHCGYSWSAEAFESLKALAEHFDGRLANWEIDYTGGSYSRAQFDMPEMERGEIADKLAELGDYNPETLKGLGDCKLTGYCADEDAIDGFRVEFLRGESDLEQLMQAAFHTWLHAVVSDYEAQYEDSEFSETSDANDYWYTATGKLN